jgi:adenylate cyclase
MGAPVDASDFEAQGLYDPEADGAADRLALLEWLAGQGVSIAAMVAADAEGRLTSLAGDRAIRPGERFPLTELAERSEIPVERVEQLRRTVGFAPVDPNEPGFTDGDIEVFRSFSLGAGVFGERAALQFSRVMGTSLSRIAEATISLFLENVEGPIRKREEGELALARANLDAIGVLDVIPRLMDSIFRGHLEEAIRRSRLAHEQGASHDTARLAVGFIDLVGFTPLSRQLDTNQLADVVDEFEARASDIVVGHDGRVVKLIGDEVMFVTVTAEAACGVALELVEAFAGEGSAVMPRGGLAYGGLLARGGDYYGETVNLASRIADLAVPYEVLVTAATLEAAASSSLDFAPAGRRMLKGFAEPVELFALSRG